ncbi:helix-turn-helix domain-containing protein [Dongia sedimenti]|uniref:Helix-turn-helix domain-containing protein n=1 Tax=Dongia sedimenti TaxID=3064282 RepID=A0ABU0YRN7_9PROT|nr:helix-turn-helix domain-containing protein [Rhodospirillaceae bacterium R-7]
MPKALDARRLQSVREIASLINAGSDLGSFFERLVFALCHHTIWRRAGIMAVDRTAGFSILVARYDPDHKKGLPDQWELKTSPSLKVAETRQPIIIEDAQTSDEFPGYREDAIARNYHTTIVLPLGCTDMQSREMVLSVSSTERVSVTEEEVDFLMTICHLAAIAVDKEKSLHAERLLTAKLERTLQINSSLLERVLGGSSMETIAGIVETILPDQIVILDFTTDSAYASRSPDVERVSDREWLDVVRGPAAKLLEKLVQDSEPSDFRQLRRINLTEIGVALDREAYVEPLRVDNETVGGLVIFPRQRGLDDLDFLIAQEARFALSAQIMRTHIQLRRQDSQIAEFFEQLFEGSWTDIRQIESRGDRLGIDLSAPAHVLAIDSNKAGASGEEAGQLLRHLSRVAKQARPSATVVAHRGVVFVHLPSAPKQAEGFVAMLGRQLVDAAKWSHSADPVVALGPVCQSPADYHAARDQCIRLLTLAKIFGRQGLVRQQDFGAFAVLLSSVDNAVMQQFVRATLGEIEAYDQEHDMELLETASAFIDQSCRFRATATELNIHVSTLRYRLERLKELFSLDLENPETRFAFVFALKLRTMIGPGAKSEKR